MRSHPQVQTPPVDLRERLCQGRFLSRRTIPGKAQKSVLPARSVSSGNRDPTGESTENCLEFIIFDLRLSATISLNRCRRRVTKPTSQHSCPAL